MVALLERVPMGRISARVEGERAPLNLGRVLLALLGGALYGLGWVVRHGVRLVLTGLAAVLWGVGYALRWAAAAIAVGWQDASGRGGS